MDGNLEGTIKLADGSTRRAYVNKGEKAVWYYSKRGKGDVIREATPKQAETFVFDLPQELGEEDTIAEVVDLGWSEGLVTIEEVIDTVTKAHEIVTRTCDNMVYAGRFAVMVRTAHQEGQMLKDDGKPPYVSKSLVEATARELLGIKLWRTVEEDRMILSYPMHPDAVRALSGVPR